MRKPNLPILLVITLLFGVFTLGFFLGRNQNRNAITVSVPAKILTEPTVHKENDTEPTEVTMIVSFPVSINHAGKEEFMALPGIGEVLAERILNFREEHGNFSSVDELLNVEGIGKKRLEEILDLITVGG